MSPALPAVVNDVGIMLVARPDVDDAVVIDYGAPGPVVVLVKPDGFTSGPELRDACAEMLGDDVASRIVVALTIESPERGPELPDAESVLRGAIYTYHYEPPATETEEWVAALWDEVLGRSRTGVTDDFLDLGGDSATAVRVVTGITIEYGVEIDLMQFFNNPSVRHVAALVDTGLREGAAG